MTHIKVRETADCLMGELKVWGGRASRLYARPGAHERPGHGIVWWVNNSDPSDECSTQA